MNSQPVNIVLHTFHSPKFKSVVKKAIEFFENTPIHPLPPLGSFVGVGVYALYYTGSSKIYDRVARLNMQNCTQPIYVGKAVPPGWRAARNAPEEKSGALRGRLREHERSITQCSNLKVDDFQCRFIILDGIETDLISAVEAELIRRFKPLWNTLVDGFGNHDPGKGRYNQARSEWDVIHPGRSWAKRLTGESPNRAKVRSKIKQGA